MLGFDSQVTRSCTMVSNHCTTDLQLILEKELSLKLFTL